MIVNVRPRLSELMKEKGWTQTKLAEASGVPQGSISRFDKNERHVDSHVFSIARALGVSVEDLFEVIEEEPAK
jgi:transcriptional regulator with XRE-family HTH domain